MFNGLRRRVGLWYSRVHFRKDRDRVLSFPETFARSRRALVVFPEAPADVDAAAAVVRHLATYYGEGAIVVVVRQDLRAALATVPAVRLLSYDPKVDVNSWFIPRKEFLRRTRTTSYDVAFDLNVPLDLTGAFLCKASSAPLRVSFAKEQGDRFYNLQVHPRSMPAGPTAYRGFLRCLEMFERT